MVAVAVGAAAVARAPVAPVDVGPVSPPPCGPCCCAIAGAQPKPKPIASSQGVPRFHHQQEETRLQGWVAALHSPADQVKQCRADQFP